MISQNSQENAYARVSIVIKLQVAAQLFSCEFCKIFNCTFFAEHLWVAASELRTF